MISVIDVPEQRQLNGCLHQSWHVGSLCQQIGWDCGSKMFQSVGSHVPRSITCKFSVSAHSMHIELTITPLHENRFLRSIFTTTPVMGVAWSLDGRKKQRYIAALWLSGINTWRIAFSISSRTIIFWFKKRFASLDVFPRRSDWK
jgi:hypothetical protein